jgi:hypothetical protein
MAQTSLLADLRAPLHGNQAAAVRNPVFAPRRRGLQPRSLTCCSIFLCGFSEYATTLLAISSSIPRFQRGFRNGISRPEAAIREHTNEGKLRVYGIMYRLNVSFANIVGHCCALQKSGVLTHKNAHLYQSYAQELQAEINQDVVETLDGIESHDMFGFGKVRSAREKELRDPDDVFIQAEARRRELARQSKKHRARSNKKDATGQSRVNRPAAKRMPAGKKIR